MLNANKDTISVTFAHMVTSHRETQAVTGKVPSRAISTFRCVKKAMIEMWWETQNC